MTLIATKCVCCDSTSLQKSPAVLMPFVAHRAYGWAPVDIDSSWGLNTIQEGRAYSVCNSVLCENCGLLFCDIRFDDEALSRLYKNYRGEEYTRLRELYEPGYCKRNESFASGHNYLHQVEEFLSPLLPMSLNILDWGGDTGINTPYRHSAKLVHVYDISSTSPVSDIRSISREEASQYQYDLVVCTNVLEHAPFPRDTLRQICEHLSESSLLFIEVPHEIHMRLHPSRLACLNGKRHWHEHVNFFTEDSLINLVQKEGLDVVKIKDVQIEQEEVNFNQYMLACKRRR